MNIILLENFKKLGRLGDEVVVRSGYARNYLLPSGKALLANKDNRDYFEKRREELEANAADSLQRAELRLKKIQAIDSISVEMRASDEGKLYGSVGVKQVTQALEEAGVHVDQQEAYLPDGAIRSVGEYFVAIHLHVDLQEVKVKLLVKSL